MVERRGFLRAWLALFAAHAAIAAAIAFVSKLGLPGWLRDPLGAFSVFTMYAPIALVSRLGAPRAAFERAAWLFGDLTPAGWALVAASWLVVHAVLAWVLVAVASARR